MKGKLTVTRTYYKTAEVEVEDVTKFESEDALVNDEKLNSEIEERLGEASLDGGETEMEVSYEGKNPFKGKKAKKDNPLGLEISIKGPAIERPSLGVMPFNLALEQFLNEREQEVEKAIKRRLKNETYDVPEEWIAEVNGIREWRRNAQREKKEMRRKEAERRFDTGSPFPAILGSLFENLGRR